MQQFTAVLKWILIIVSGIWFASAGMSHLIKNPNSTIEFFGAEMNALNAFGVVLLFSMSCLCVVYLKLTIKHAIDLYRYFRGNDE